MAYQLQSFIIDAAGFLSIFPPNFTIYLKKFTSIESGKNHFSFQGKKRNNSKIFLSIHEMKPTGFASSPALRSLQFACNIRKPLKLKAFLFIASG